MKFKTINPATNEVIGEYELYQRSRVMEILDASAHEYTRWKLRALDDRIALIYELARVLRTNKESWASLMTEEMGKPITESRVEIEKCAWTAETYADNAANWLAEEIVDADGLVNKVVFQPLGVIVAIMPWNYPFWQALRFAIPTLLVGNTALLKHSNVVPKCAMAIEEAFKLAGFPENVFRTLLMDHETTSHLIAAEPVKGVSLTGSTSAGKKIGSLAGRHLKKAVLELGGSDPFIVLEDADLDLAAKGAVAGRFGNCGQSCVASKRFLVHEDVAEEFSRRFTEEVQKIVVGDPIDPVTGMGPMVNNRALEEVEAQLQDALDKGARLLTGGARAGSKGCFFEPTILADATIDMQVVADEVFGPIAPIVVVRSSDEAIEIANSSEFGLGGSVWTGDVAKGEQVAMQIESGIVFVNSISKSDPRMPFGGVKHSGIGRELGRYGLMEFANAKGVSVYEG